jgi:ABC-2 type transport system ATP-binding protein
VRFPQRATVGHNRPAVPEIVLQSVSKSFDHRAALFGMLGERRGSTVALDDVTLTVERGRVLALLGANGAGKTTLLKLICTMLLPESGSVAVAGFDTVRQPGEVRRRVGFALAHERSFYPRLTASENLNFYAALEDVPRAMRPARIVQALETCGLAAWSDVLAYKFSSGMFQRLSIARALIKQPDVLLLDEPTRSIDPEGSEDLWRTVRRLAAAGTTIVAATHDFEEAVAIGDAVAVLDHGTLAASTDLRGLDTADALREFYFRHVSANSHAESAVATGVRR